MPALATLTTTTLVTPVSSSDTSIQLTSTSGIIPGLFLYCDMELMRVTGLGLGTWVNVRRGMDGTAGSAHASLQPVTIGRGDQFYRSNPVGAPPPSVLVSPWINVLTGEQWTPQGDETGPNAARWWARTEYTHGIGALGVRTDVGAASAVTVN